MVGIRAIGAVPARAAPARTGDDGVVPDDPGGTGRRAVATLTVAVEDGIAHDHGRDKAAVVIHVETADILAAAAGAIVRDRQIDKLGGIGNVDRDRAGVARAVVPRHQGVENLRGVAKCLKTNACRDRSRVAHHPAARDRDLDGVAEEKATAIVRDRVLRDVAILERHRQPGPALGVETAAAPGPVAADLAVPDGRVAQHPHAAAEVIAAAALVVRATEDQAGYHAAAAFDSEDGGRGVRPGDIGIAERNAAGIGRVIAIDVAREDGGMRVRVGLGLGGFAAGESAAQQNSRWNGEADGGVAGGRVVNALGHPYLIAGHRHGQGALEIGVGIRP